MPYAPTVFRENDRDVLEPFESGPGLRWITVKLSDGDRHCDADLMRMVIERLQDEKVMVHSESNNRSWDILCRVTASVTGLFLDSSALIYFPASDPEFSRDLASPLHSPCTLI